MRYDLNCVESTVKLHAADSKGIQPIKKPVPHIQKVPSGTRKRNVALANWGSTGKQALKWHYTLTALYRVSSSISRLTLISELMVWIFLLLTCSEYQLCHSGQWLTCSAEHDYYHHSVSHGPEITSLWNLIYWACCDRSRSMSCEKATSVQQEISASAFKNILIWASNMTPTLAYMAWTST